jgi:hypothetical protein
MKSEISECVAESASFLWAKRLKVITRFQRSAVSIFSFLGLALGYPEMHLPPSPTGRRTGLTATDASADRSVLPDC